MLEKLSVHDLDSSFDVVFVLITLISGFLFIYEGRTPDDLVFKYYFGLNFIPIIILGLSWWVGIFFHKTVVKMFSWFMAFVLLVQSILLVLASLFPSTPLYLFPITPVFAVPFEYLVCRQYSIVGEKMDSTQKFRLFFVGLIYTIIEMLWFIILLLWLVLELLKIAFV